LPDDPFIGFQLRFARTSGANPGAQSLEMTPFAG